MQSEAEKELIVSLSIGIGCTVRLKVMTYLSGLEMKCQSYLGLGIGVKECDCFVGTAHSLQR